MQHVTGTLIATVLFMFISIPGMAAADDAPGGVITHHELGIGGMLHTNGSTGAGLVLQYGNRRTALKYRFFSFHLVMLKHPKEVRSIQRTTEDARPFVYGKKNAFPAVRLILGQNHILSKQYEHRDVLVAFTYGGGISIGMLKPVYINVIEHRGDGQAVSTVQFDPEKHTVENIQGGAGFFRGIGETEPRIGAGFKSGLAFRWNNHNNRYRRLETGFSLDVFPSEIPIFAQIDNKHLFFNLYLTYSIGRNW